MNDLDYFLEVHRKALNTNDKANMEIADDIMRKAVARLYALSPLDVKELAETYDGEMSYSNFLTEKEAKAIVAGFVNADGTKGPKWDAKAFLDDIEAMGGSTDSVPYFNKWALYAVACMVSSDQGVNITKWLGDNKDNYMAMVYDFAVGHLSDKDKPKFARWYFGLE